jgi:putative two-component system response regulator
MPVSSISEESPAEIQAEALRLHALRGYGILDTAPEKGFDDITRLAAQICDAPIALVSLVEAGRQWFKSRVGLEVCDTSREVSFCAHALHQDDLFIVPDALLDPRFAGNPLVTGDPHIRFYAGAPLITPEGQTLGTLCVIDRIPRALSPSQQQALQSLGRMVVALLELRRNNARQAGLLAERDEAERALRTSEALKSAMLASALDCVITIDDRERVLEWNPAAEATFGYSKAEALGQALSSLIIPQALRGAHDRGLAHFLKTGEGSVLNTRIEVPALRRNGTEFQVELTVIPIRLEGRHLFTAYVRDITDRQAVADALRRAHDDLCDANANLDRRVHERTDALEQANRDLQAAEARYRGIFENAVEGIFQSAADGKCLVVNPAFAHILGYDSPEDVSTNVTDIARQLYADADRRDEFQRLMAEVGTVSGFEARGCRKDGRIIWVSLHARTVLDAGGEVAFYEGSLEDITEHKQAEEERRAAQTKITGLNRELLQAYDATIEGWSRALDLRDKETEGHCQRVTELTLRLAVTMGFSDADLIHIRRGALLHDIGKMGIPDGILLKPGPLTDAEWSIMRLHPTYAHEMLSPIDFLRPALDIPWCHHEKWDGTGYPRGLAGEQIPPAARLFALADVWDALRSDRPYRQGWSAERVLDHLISLSGSHFDPAAVGAFLRLVADDPSLKDALPSSTELLFAA